MNVAAARRRVNAAASLPRVDISAVVPAQAGTTAVFVALAPDRARDCLLRFFLDAPEVIFADEAFGVDFVDVFGA